MDPSNPDSTFSYGSRLRYNVRNFAVSLAHQIIGNNFNAEVGFVPRTGIQSFSPSVEARIFPNSTVINSHNFQLQTNLLWNSAKRKTDHLIQLDYGISFMNQTRLNMSINEEYIYLFDDFDPTRTGGEPLPAGSSYTFRYFQTRYNSDQRKAFTVNMSGSAGQFFNGQRYRLGGDLNYRFQPYGNIGVNVQYNSVKLPQPHNSADLVLIGPRIDITFTKTLYLTGLFQYNNQIDNFNTNIRFQWRYKPVSDIFLVYTDNYYASNFNVKNRSLVFKLTYWLNL